MSRQPDNDPTVDAVRRKLLKTTAVAGGALAAGLLPYEKPAIKSFFGTPSAWAQVTGPMMISFGGQLGTGATAVSQDTGQDLFAFGILVDGTTLTIDAQPDLNLDIEIFLFAPGDGPGNDNLLTGTVFGFTNAGVGGAEMATVGPLPAGTYTFGIEDERGPGDEVVGTYTVTITADQPLSAAVPAGDELPESDLGSSR